LRKRRSKPKIGTAGRARDLWVKATDARSADGLSAHAVRVHLNAPNVWWAAYDSRGVLE
jgi:hypothetical protein